MDLWNSLASTYGKSSTSTVFKDFKECINACITVYNNPIIYFEKVIAAYGCMGAAGVTILAQLQAMISLAALSKKWEMLVLVVTRDNKLKNLTLGDVCTAVIMQYQ
jgi:hypothetical protein